MEAHSAWAWCVEHEARTSQVPTYHNMLVDWIELATDQAAARVTAQLTASNWPRARLAARRHLYQALGLDPLPARTTDCASRCVGVLARDGYRVERLVLEPRPNFLMPVHLYVPTGVHYPVPAVVYAPGHWMINGKTEPDIQAFCIGLVKQGYVVLVFDPIGQGERGATFEDHARRELLLLGLSQEGLMAWETMRAIDYLLTRPEVDGNRLGMTGASGGGLNTIYTCAADERIAVSVPVCYVTSFGRFLRAMRGLNWNNQNDLCNQVPNVIRDAEMAGLCGLIHPRPLLIINGHLDPQFPVAGAQEVVDQLADVYAGVDVERLRLTAIQADHGYDRQMREAAYGWFRRWLYGQGTGEPIAEPDHTTEPPDLPDLKCFVGAPYVRSWPAIRQLARTAAQTLVHEPPVPTTTVDWTAWTADLRARLADCLNVQPELPASQGELTDRAGLAERHLLHPEAGIVVPAYVVRPDSAPRQVIVCLSDEGKLGGLAAEAVPSAVARGAAALLFDPRGLGETTPRPPPQQTVATLDGKLEYRETTSSDTLEFEVATDTLMLGQPLLGRQVADTLSALAYARHLFAGLPLTLLGSGPISSLVALYSAALSEQVGALVADRLLPSYNLLIADDQQAFPITAYVFNILRVADIPQVAAAIAPRPLTVLRPVDARLQALAAAEASRLWQWARGAYAQGAAPVPAIYDTLADSELVDRLVPATA